MRKTGKFEMVHTILPNFPSKEIKPIGRKVK